MRDLLSKGEPYRGQTVGMARERSPGSIKDWAKFLSVLQVPLQISELAVEKAAELSTRHFRSSSDYCFFRKSCLGQYVNLVQDFGCRLILVPVKKKPGLLSCNASRFMATEVAHYFDELNVTVVNCPVSTERSARLAELRRVAEYFRPRDQELIESALATVPKTAHRRTNVYDISKGPHQLTIMQIGKVNRFFDYTDPSSPVEKFLADKLNVRIVDPETVGGRKIGQYRRAVELVRQAKHALPRNRESYWPEHLVAHSLLSVRDRIDGVVLVRDCFCNAGIEEINVLERIVRQIGLPQLTIAYNPRSQSNVETALETFVEMVRWKKQRHGEST